jgi:hypothetical protein
LTATSTELFRIAAWERASSLLFAIAHPLFHQAIHKPEFGEQSEKTYQAWLTLRRIATLYFERRSTRLMPAERERMIGALQFAHDSHHDSLMNVSEKKGTEHCQCTIAAKLRELALLLAEEEESNAGTN